MEEESNPKRRKLEEPTITKKDNKNYRPIIESSSGQNGSTSLLLFYQYVEPPWNEQVYKEAKRMVETIATTHNITGRMRVAKEGLNCTLSGSRSNLYDTIHSLRTWKPELFAQTEFKLTHDLPHAQRFKEVKILPVQELVHYGLTGPKAPPTSQYHGTHLEPRHYHEKLQQQQEDTVVIDVRNHYEASIGKFAGSIDPGMRKSTEFPLWLDHPHTQAQLQNKHVLMYCTGGIRCERASALLKYKMEHDEEVKKLNIKGVYQLQGGIDKYFKEFPEGGMWVGKNYTFDKRFAHTPTQVAEPVTLGKCQVCSKPWDKFRGKRRCPTCGVPSLICRECLEKKDTVVRCDLCVEQNVTSKKDLRRKEQEELKRYEQRQAEKGLLNIAQPTTSNPDNVTRLYIKNLCRNSMTDEILLEFLPHVTHLVWNVKQGTFLGQAWVEMDSPASASDAVQKSGSVLLGRKVYIEFQPPNPKDVWPPPKSAVV